MTTRKGPGDLGHHGPFKKPKLQPPAAAAACADILWCEDSDDDDLILLASQQVEQNQCPAAPTNFSAFMSDIDKDPRTSTQHTTTKSPPPVSVNVALRAKVTSNLVLNQNKASQDFLRKRIETLEKDIQKSNAESTAAAEKIQIRDYEVSSLRFEMKELQKANSELRLKLVKNEQFNREIQRSKTMEKQLQKAETELELKRLELLKLKSDRRMSTQANQMDTTTTTTVTSNVTKKSHDPPQPQLFHLDVMVGRYEVTKCDSWQVRLGHRIFENVVGDVGMGTAVFVEQLAHLQRAMGLVITGQPVNVDEFVGHTLAGMRLALNSISMKYDSSLQMLGGSGGGGGGRRHRSSRRIVLSDHNNNGLERANVCIYDKE